MAIPPQQQTQPPATPPPGLINQTPTGGGPAATTYTPAQATAAETKSTSYDPNAFTVTPEQTVQRQLKDIISSGSPLLRQAEAQARATMNRRGLINSSMGITAGHSAVIGAALPIAAADAATYERAGTNTTTARNRALEFGAAAENTAGLQDAALETQTSQFNVGQTNRAGELASTASNQQRLADLQGRNDRLLQGLVNSGRLEQINAQGYYSIKLQEMSDKNRLLLQTSQGASSYYNTMLQYMGAITTDPNMTKNQKAVALNNAVTQLNDNLDTLTSIAGIPGVQSTLNFETEDMGGVGGGGFGNVSDTQGATGAVGFDPSQTQAPINA